MGVITPPGCTQRLRPAGRWWRNLRAAWRCRARGRSLEVGGQGGHGGPGCAGSAALVCARTEAHTGTRTRALHAHLPACVRRRVAHAQLHACSICTHKHAHTHAHARARTQPPASRVLSTRGQQTPTAARTRSPTPRLHTHAPSRVHANARTDPRVGARSHAQPTHTTPPPRPPNTACQRRGGEEAGGDTTGWDGEARGCRERVPGVAGGNADCAAAGGAVAERLRAVLRDLDVAHEAFAGGDGVSSPPTDADTDAAAAT